MRKIQNSDVKISEFIMASLEGKFALVAAKFKIFSLNPLQKRAIKVIIDKKKDVFVNLPTGFGKSFYLSSTTDRLFE